MVVHGPEEQRFLGEFQRPLAVADLPVLDRRVDPGRVVQHHEVGVGRADDGLHQLQGRGEFVPLHVSGMPRLETR